jgi:hypothetical protein
MPDLTLEEAYAALRVAVDKAMQAAKCPPRVTVVPIVGQAYLTFSRDREHVYVAIPHGSMSVHATDVHLYFDDIDHAQRVADAINGATVQVSQAPPAPLYEWLGHVRNGRWSEAAFWENLVKHFSKIKENPR